MRGRVLYEEIRYIFIRLYIFLHFSKLQYNVECSFRKCFYPLCTAITLVKCSFVQNSILNFYPKVKHIGIQTFVKSHLKDFSRFSSYRAICIVSIDTLRYQKCNFTKAFNPMILIPLRQTITDNLHLYSIF